MHLGRQFFYFCILPVLFRSFLFRLKHSTPQAQPPSTYCILPSVSSMLFPLCSLLFTLYPMPFALYPMLAPLCPVAPEDGTGVGPEDRTGAPCPMLSALCSALCLLRLTRSTVPVSQINVRIFRPVGSTDHGFRSQ
jgi:hypothetical protein